MGSYYSYIAIDLKSFYASVECREHGFDPLTTNLVVADASRTEKTICLAVSPSLKAYGVGGRARLFEVIQKVREVNADRLQNLRRLKRSKKALSNNSKVLSEQSCNSSFNQEVIMSGDSLGTQMDAYRSFEGAEFRESSFDDNTVKADPSLELDYFIAKPRMALYLDYSTRIYEIYLKYFAPEDIHVYSIDEVLIDATKYLRIHGSDSKALASRIVKDIYQTTGITATAGIGTNLYLAKVAMDILAKHEEPDENGVRIAFLDEQSYRQRLWSHKPLTDFWRVGIGYQKRLESYGMYTMGDVARCSLGPDYGGKGEEFLFDIFGKNAELLIDHAWGKEPVTMEAIKAYKPQVESTVSGQVLHCPYNFQDARLVVWEMADQLALDLRASSMETDKLTLTVSYDRNCLEKESAEGNFAGEITIDRWGRKIPKHAHGTTNLVTSTASSLLLTKAVLELYDRTVNPHLLVKKISIGAENLISQSQAEHNRQFGQMSLFGDEDINKDGNNNSLDEDLLNREKNIQDTMLTIRDKFGKNAILKAPNLKEQATARQRNNQIGGHSA